MEMLGNMSLCADFSRYIEVFVLWSERRMAKPHTHTDALTRLLQINFVFTPFILLSHPLCTHTHTHALLNETTFLPFLPWSWFPDLTRYAPSPSSSLFLHSFKSYNHKHASWFFPKCHVFRLNFLWILWLLINRISHHIFLFDKTIFITKKDSKQLLKHQYTNACLLSVQLL